MVNIVKTESEIKKAEEEKTPTKSQPTETSSATSSITTTEKEREVESEPTTSAESKPLTTPPKTEATVTETPKPIQNTSSAVESTETPPIEEICNTQPYVDTADIEKLVVQFINEHRVVQGDAAAMLLTGLTEVARYRAKQLVTNFSHHSIQSIEKNMAEIIFKLAVEVANQNHLIATQMNLSEDVLDSPKKYREFPQSSLRINNLFALLFLPKS